MNNLLFDGLKWYQDSVLYDVETFIICLRYKSH